MESHSVCVSVLSIGSMNSATASTRALFMGVELGVDSGVVTGVDDSIGSSWSLPYCSGIHVSASLVFGRAWTSNSHKVTNI